MVLVVAIGFFAPREASASCTGTTLTVPTDGSGTTITTSGVYCLTSDVVVTPTAAYSSSIVVNVSSSSSTNAVVIDLGGFALRCAGTYCGTASGVYSANVRGLVVQDGRLADFNIDIYLYNGIGANIRDLRFSWYGATGTTAIYQDALFSGAVIENNTFANSNGTGVYLYYPSGFTIDNNSFTGLYDAIYVILDVSSVGGSIIGNRFNTTSYAINASGYSLTPMSYRDNISINSTYGYYCAANCTYVHDEGNNSAH